MRMTDPEIVNWLAAMDLQISDPNMVLPGQIVISSPPMAACSCNYMAPRFDMVAEDGNITAEQLVKGVSRLKGSARSSLECCGLSR